MGDVDIVNRFKGYSGEEEDKAIKNSFQVSDLGNGTASGPFPELGKIGGEGPLTRRSLLHFKQVILVNVAHHHGNVWAVFRNGYLELWRGMQQGIYKDT